MFRHGALLVASALACFSVDAANANITFSLGNTPGGDNVLLTNGLSGNPVTGTVDNTTISFSSTISNETLTEQASGQAKISGSNLTQIQITSASNVGYGQVVFNVNGTSGTTATLVGTDQFGHTSSPFTFTLGPGQNFVTALASSGELIEKVAISTSAAFSDLEQVRVGGVTTLAVPAPAVGAGLPSLLAACGALVFLARRRRHAHA